MDLGPGELARFAGAAEPSEVRTRSGRLRSDDGRFQILGSTLTGIDREVTFGQADGDYDVTLTTAGDVGIGTSTPDAKLDVDGGMIVNGDLRATGRLIGDQLVSQTTSGPPLTVGSTAKVVNLNTDFFDSRHAGAYTRFGPAVDTNEIAPGAVGGKSRSPCHCSSGVFVFPLH